VLPFTTEQFFAVFATYNDAIWPIQIIAYLIAVVTAALAWHSNSAASRRLILSLLALMWGWTGVAYFWLHFLVLTPMALVFGALFVFQAVLLAYTAVSRKSSGFRPSRGASRALAVALIVYSMVVYPAIGLWTGHALGELPMLGVTPCPVTIFTFGILLLDARVPPILLPIPVLWSLVGGTGGFLLGVPQDWVLFFSGAAAAALIISGASHEGSAITSPRRLSQ
jgi:hypothetical protein